MNLIVDASVAVKWVLPEELSGLAISLLRSGHTLSAPDLIAAEIASALWKRSTKGQVGGFNIDELLQQALNSELHLYASPALVPRALALSVELGHPVYDCIYLAAAEREQAVLVTVDQAFLTRLSRTKHKALARRLQEL